MDSFAKFLSINGLKKKDIAAYLGVSNAFITQICAGARRLPADKLTLIKANSDWDSSMLLSDVERAKAIHLDQFDRGISYEVTPEKLQEAIEKALVPEENSLISHLQRKADNQERLIRELYKEIGMLEAKLDLAMNGDVTGVITSIFPKEKA